MNVLCDYIDQGCLLIPYEVALNIPMLWDSSFQLLASSSGWKHYYSLELFCPLHTFIPNFLAGYYFGINSSAQILNNFSESVSHIHWPLGPSYTSNSFQNLVFILGSLYSGKLDHLKTHLIHFFTVQVPTESAPISLLSFYDNCTRYNNHNIALLSTVSDSHLFLNHFCLDFDNISAYANDINGFWLNPDEIIHPSSIDFRYISTLVTESFVSYVHLLLLSGPQFEFPIPSSPYDTSELSVFFSSLYSLLSHQIFALIQQYFTPFSFPYPLSITLSSHCLIEALPIISSQFLPKDLFILPHTGGHQGILWIASLIQNHPSVCRSLPNKPFRYNYLSFSDFHGFAN